MKKFISGYLYNKIELINGQKYRHIGFESDQGDFGDIMESLVPRTGDKIKAKLIVKTMDKDLA